MPCPDLRDWRRVAAAGELHTAGTTDPPGRRTAGLHPRRWGTEECEPIGINLSEKERKNVRTFETSRRGGSGAGWSGGPCGQYISLKDLPREAPKREDQAGRQNRETAPPDQRAQVEA